MKSTHGDGQHSETFTESHAFFLTILMIMFTIAVALSIVGLTYPSWLGFD